MGRARSGLTQTAATMPTLAPPRPRGKRGLRRHSNRCIISRVAALLETRYPYPMAERHQEFWKKHPGLVWSNPEANDAIQIRATLLRPQFDRLLDIAGEFGLERLRLEWSILLDEHTSETSRAHDSVERILTNIENGFSSVASGN